MLAELLHPHPGILILCAGGAAILVAGSVITIVAMLWPPERRP